MISPAQSVQCIADFIVEPHGPSQQGDHRLWECVLFPAAAAMIWGIV